MEEKNRYALFSKPDKLHTFPLQLDYERLQVLSRSSLDSLVLFTPPWGKCTRAKWGKERDKREGRGKRERKKRTFKQGRLSFFFFFTLRNPAKKSKRNREVPKATLNLRHGICKWRLEVRRTWNTCLRKVTFASDGRNKPACPKFVNECAPYHWTEQVGLRGANS